MGKGLKVRCGKCKKVFPVGHAHNARTCGKTVLRAQPALALPVTVSAKLNDEQVEPLPSSVLTTWWILQDGNLGKQKKGENYHQLWDEGSQQKLVEFVSVVESSEDRPTITEWGKFFRKFGAEAKRRYITSCMPTAQVDVVLWDDTKSEAQQYIDEHSPTVPNSIPHVNHWEVPQEDQEAVVKLPQRLFSVFVKDPSVITRRVLATREGLPGRIKEQLLQDTNVTVLTFLAKREDLTSEDIRTIFNRACSGEGFKTFNATEVAELHETIASHPHTSEDIIVEYLHNPTLGWGAHANAAAHPKAPPEKVREVFNSHLPALVELMNTVKRERNLKLRGYENSDAGKELTQLLRYVRQAQPHLSRTQIKEVLNLHFRDGMYTEQLFPSDAKGVNFTSFYSKQTIPTVAKLFRSTQLTSEDLHHYYDKVSRESLQEGTSVGLSILINPNTPHGVIRSHVRIAEHSRRPVARDLCALEEKVLAIRLRRTP